MTKALLAIAFGAGAALLAVVLVPLPPKPTVMDRVAAAAAEDWANFMLEMCG